MTLYCIHDNVLKCLSIPTLIEQMVANIGLSFFFEGTSQLIAKPAPHIHSLHLIMFMYNIKCDQYVYYFAVKELHGNISFNQIDYLNKSELLSHYLSGVYHVIQDVLSTCNMTTNYNGANIWNI